MTPSRQLSIKAWMLVLTQVVAIPLIAFSLFSLFKFWKLQEEVIVTSLAQRTEAAANSIGQRLSSLAETATTITLGPAAQNDDLPALYEYVVRVQRTLPDVASIALIGPEGQQFFNTLRPFGALLPRTGNPALVQRVFATGRPAVSGPFIGGVSQRYITIIGVPLVIDGTIRYCLALAVRAEVLNQLLGAEHLPADWIATIIDESGTILARTRAPEAHIGTRTSPSLLAALEEGRQGVFATTTKDDILIQTAMAKVPFGNWTVAIGVSDAALRAPLHQSLAIFGLGGSVLSLMGIGAALLLSRRLGNEVARAAAASAALTDGEAFPRFHTVIREFRDLGATIDTVREREQQRSAELSQARHDHLTGLPGRALFLEMAEAMRARCAADPSRSAALLFIDLDGFKHLNDTMGHEAGDRVLVDTGRAIRGVLRDSDFSGRLGGDEFVVGIMAPTQDIEATAASVAERVLIRIGGIGDGIGCSIGISFLPAACAKPSCEMKLSCALKRADEAMYEAKRQGKSRYVILGRPRTAPENGIS